MLTLMAEGLSNTAIAARLRVTDKAIGKHTASIFANLGLPPCDDHNRRVMAVLAYIGAEPA
ncbi:LuxR C-terminal-related transcriptional regulator [Nonomuraea terrae]|uniref:LuxR C-terminal-related transcriptional regulator n=1 Tax=Nonomuraea terrae TaxID=2530383 RepID=UPI0037B8FBCF